MKSPCIGCPSDDGLISFSERHINSVVFSSISPSSPIKLTSIVNSVLAVYSSVNKAKRKILTVFSALLNAKPFICLNEIDISSLVSFLSGESVLSVLSVSLVSSLSLCSSVKSVSIISVPLSIKVISVPLSIKVISVPLSIKVISVPLSIKVISVPLSIKVILPSAQVISLSDLMLPKVNNSSNPFLNICCSKIIFC